MTKFQMLAAAAITLAAACAGNQATRTEAQSSTAQTAQTSVAPAPSTQTQTATPAPRQEAQTPAASAAPATFTDDQLRSFAHAAVEIDPISRTLSAATPAQQATATEQIRQILMRNNLDGATYNAIAAQAQRDPAFASQIASLNRTDPNNG
jgi:hypothetical protein